MAPRAAAERCGCGAGGSACPLEVLRMCLHAAHHFRHLHRAGSAKLGCNCMGWSGMCMQELTQTLTTPIPLLSTLSMTLTMAAVMGPCSPPPVPLLLPELQPLPPRLVLAAAVPPLTDPPMLPGAPKLALGVGVLDPLSPLEKRLRGGVPVGHEVGVGTGLSCRGVAFAGTAWRQCCSC